MYQSTVSFIDDFSDSVMPENSDKGLRVIKKNSFILNTVESSQEAILSFSVEDFYANKKRQDKLVKEIEKQKEYLSSILDELETEIKNLKPQELIQLLAEKRLVEKLIDNLKKELFKIFSKNIENKNIFYYILISL